MTIVAASKGQPAADIRALYDMGLQNCGENYLQDALPKITALADCDITWHFIGPVQSNKTRDIALHFDWVQSIDRLSIAQRLSAQRPDSLPPLQVMLQVNIGAESAKSGVAMQEAAGFCNEIMQLPRLQLRGLMTIPPAEALSERQRVHFDAMRNLQRNLLENGLPVTELSMGMSADLVQAIAAGATMVRPGTALFGPRPSKTGLAR